jgi:hypothetical protein
MGMKASVSIVSRSEAFNLEARALTNASCLVKVEANGVVKQIGRQPLAGRDRGYGEFFT